MPNRRFPHTASGRVSGRELARVDAAVRLSGSENRAAFVRKVVIEAAARVLRKHALHPTDAVAGNVGPTPPAA